MTRTCYAERFTWWRAIRTSTLSPTARHVALTLATYMNKEGGGAWPSMATLADDTGRSRPVVKRAIRELRETGFLTVESGGGRRADGGYVSNRYRASIPSAVLIPNGVVDDTDDASREVVDDTAGDPDDDEGGGSSQQGGGSSQQGGGSWTNGNGVVDDPRSIHELAIHESIQHSAKTSPASDDAEIAFDLGSRYRDHVNNGKLSYEDFVQVADTYTGETRQAFMKGYQKEVAS